MRRADASDGYRTDGRWSRLLVCFPHQFGVIVLMTVLATGIDGTSQASLSIPCPDVSPYSKIYFLQL